MYNFQFACWAFLLRDFRYLEKSIASFPFPLFLLFHKKDFTTLGHLHANVKSTIHHQKFNGLHVFFFPSLLGKIFELYFLYRMEFILPKVVFPFLHIL